MGYSCHFTDLLLTLYRKTPALANSVALDWRKVVDGRLSVGLKVHCLENAEAFAPFILELGGAQKAFRNLYKMRKASFCLVLPPVGSVQTAVKLLESIGAYTGVNLLRNPAIHLQLCSPGRLNAQRSAILAIAHYLGSDVLRRYTWSFKTTFTKSDTYPRGRRLILYDAEGMFEHFEWWMSEGKVPLIAPGFPFKPGRSDVLMGPASPHDIEVVNRVATLLCHAEHDGYWKKLGQWFEGEFIALLRDHELSGLLTAPWVHQENAESASDEAFSAVLDELVNYAHAEVVRIQSLRRPWWKLGRTDKGLLVEVQELIHVCSEKMDRQVRPFNQGGESA